MKKLTIELVPMSMWNKNVRSIVTTKEWNAIRKKSYRKANYKCEICNGVGKKHPVECHEIWEYNEDEFYNTQKLIGLISLCPTCHKVKHIGRTISIGQEQVAINQLIKVNKYLKEDALLDIDNAFKTFIKRSEKEWNLDISYLQIV